MAVYDYECATCKSVIEISHPVSDSPTIICMTCSTARRKKFSLGAAIFKGGGWGKS